MNTNRIRSTKGFTLIELLVVIAIVAILAVVVILTLNPAELLRQARDSNRTNDMATLKSALSLYLADVSTPSLNTIAYTTCTATTSTVTAQCGGLFSTYYTATSTGSGGVSAIRKVDGSGWVPVNFLQISAGAPLGNLPIDPVNNGTNYYAYAASSTNLTFEVDAAAMESAKYKSGGAGDVVSTDGGNNATAYEVGTAPGLSL